MAVAQSQVPAQIARMVERADADFEAGRYVTVSTPEESQARHEAAMNRLRARLAGNAAREG